MGLWVSPMYYSLFTFSLDVRFSTHICYTTIFLLRVSSFHSYGMLLHKRFFFFIHMHLYCPCCFTQQHMLSDHHCRKDFRYSSFNHWLWCHLLGQMWVNFILFNVRLLPHTCYTTSSLLKCEFNSTYTCTVVARALNMIRLLTILLSRRLFTHKKLVKLFA